MSKLSSSAVKKELAALPIARIETMDVSYILALREYLFTNGCQVFVNTGPTENVTYFFVVGDSDFVKKTLAFRHELGKKQLIICWDSENHDSIDQFLGTSSKIVYVDPVPMTSTMLHEIFVFLFTTKGKELNMQSPGKKSTQKNYSSTIPIIMEPIETNDVEPLIPSSSRAYEDIQKNRIAKTITDMFGKQAHLEDRDKKIQKKQLHPKKRVVLIFFIIIFCIIGPFLLYIGSFALRGWSLLTAAKCFQEGNISCVTRETNKELFWSAYTHLVTPIVHTTLRLPLGEKAIQSYERIDRLTNIMREAENELLLINNAVVSLSSSLLTNQKDATSMSTVVAMDTIKKSMPSVRIKLDLASSYLQSFRKESSFPFFLPSVQKLVEKANSKIDTLRQIAEIGERVSQIYPFIGGFRNKEHILVLLQNSSELRPTGGFIGSIAHLTVSEGTLEEMRIEDVYNLDGQLKGHIDPPEPIKELLAQEHWYLRDSNWNPDFAKTGNQVQFFYEKETGEQVETVIGLTSSFIVRILRAIGPVEIPLYNDLITADNFYLKSFYYTQANFFPGSSQKKDFLGTLMETILSKLQKNTKGSGIAIIGIIHDGLLSREIQWYTTHEEGQRAIEQFGWGGRVPAGTTCLSLENQIPCVFSYIHINEANVSVNKVNSFIQRNQMHSVQISEDGKITETITRKLQNLSQGESGTGAYTTYLRIFIPEKARLTDITLDGKPISMKDPKIKKMDLPYGELDASVPHLTGIGIAFEVAAGRERIISASFSLDDPLFTEGKESILTLYEQKQAGVDTVPTTITVSYPPTWEALPFPTVHNERMIAKPGRIEYNTLLSQDSEISIRFLK